jgi:transposase
MTGVDLTALEGIDDTTALMLVSESGFDMSRWPTVQHFASWLGWCPHQRVSGGKVLRRRTQVCANRAATALRLAASCRHHRQSALGAFFRRLKVRLGTPKAITATAHQLARLVYTMLKHGTAYVAQGMAEYEQRDQERVVQHLTRRANTWGYALVRTAEGASA